MSKPKTKPKLPKDPNLQKVKQRNGAGPMKHRNEPRKGAGRKEKEIQREQDNDLLLGEI